MCCRVQHLPMDKQWYPLLTYLIITLYNTLYATNYCGILLSTLGRPATPRQIILSIITNPTLYFIVFFRNLYAIKFYADPLLYL